MKYFESLWSRAALCGLALLVAPTTALADTVFLKSARVDVSRRVANLPLLTGVTTSGERVHFVVLDASSSEAASRYGANRAAKLENARRSTAVMKVSVVNREIIFPATVDFSPEFTVTPGPTGFPPAAFQAGATAEPGYSPLIELPDGTILNAPHIANESGQADKVLRLNASAGRVDLALTDGFANGKKVLYLSTEASDPLAAALEDVTFTPQLNFAPGLGNDGTDSARAALGATLNGQTGANNPQRQGFTSAILDGRDPLNALAWTPNQGRYSPLWDVHLGQWTAGAVSRRANVALTDFDDFGKAAKEGDLTGPGGVAFAAAGIVVNCPILVELD